MPVPTPSPSARDRSVRRVRRARTVLVGGAASAALALGSVLGLQTAWADAGTPVTPAGASTSGHAGSPGSSTATHGRSTGGSTLVGPGSGSAPHASSQGS